MIEAQKQKPKKGPDSYLSTKIIYVFYNMQAWKILHSEVINEEIQRIIKLFPKLNRQISAKLIYTKVSFNEAVCLCVCFYDVWVCVCCVGDLCVHEFVSPCTYPSVNVFVSVVSRGQDPEVGLYLYKKKKESISAGIHLPLDKKKEVYFYY